MREVYCVQWQSPIMPGPAFWYYANHDRAVSVGLKFHAQHYPVGLRRAEVPDHVVCLDEVTQ